MQRERGRGDDGALARFVFWIKMHWVPSSNSTSSFTHVLGPPIPGTGLAYQRYWEIQAQGKERRIIDEQGKETAGKQRAHATVHPVTEFPVSWHV